MSFELGLPCNFSRFWTKFEISDGHKIKKNENFKNPRITFLYHLDIYLCEQIQLNRTGSFLKLGQFMLKMAIFSAKGDFPYILKFRPRVIACKMKSFDVKTALTYLVKMKSFCSFRVFLPCLVSSFVDLNMLTSEVNLRDLIEEKTPQAGQ